MYLIYIKNIFTVNLYVLIFYKFVINTELLPIRIEYLTSLTSALLYTIFHCVLMVIFKYASVCDFYDFFPVVLWGLKYFGFW